MLTTLTIAGTGYTAAQRAAARLGWNELHLDLEGYGTATFHEFGALPSPSFQLWSTFSVTALSATVYSGRIVDCQSSQDSDGWSHGYTVMDLRALADKLVPVEDATGVGQIVLNRSPDDTYGVDSDRGLTVGQIVQRVLTVPATAGRLNALGVGGYTTLSPPTLPASTLADIALLTIVPKVPVMVQGKGIFNQLAQLVGKYYPTFVTRILPTGVLRILDTTDATVFVPATVTLPSANVGSFDPIYRWPTVRKSVNDCASRVVIRGGPEVEPAMLSLADGTLAEGFSSGDKSSWTLYDFTQPKGATDSGTITAMTSTSATILSSDATRTFATNFWSTKDATVSLLNPLATGIGLYEFRTVISNTSMAAAGTASIVWDTNWPTTNAGYTKYRLVGKAGGLIDTWRFYQVREPSTGNVGTATFIGPRLVRRSSKEVRWANQSKSLGEYYTQAVVVGGSVSTEVPWQVEPVPSLGGFRFVQPTVLAHGQQQLLLNGSPTTVAQGLPSDVQILALYSRGALTAAYPADISGVPQYAGTTHTVCGMDVTEYVDYPSWTWKNDATDMATLAQQFHAALSPVNYDVSFDWSVGQAGTLPSWNWLTFGNSINIAIAGTTSPWSAINCPVRSVRIKWTGGQGNQPIQTISFTASNKRKQFGGDDLYVHPQFASGSPLGGEGIGGGFMGGDMSSMLMQGTPDVGFGSGASAAQGMMSPANALMNNFIANQQSVADSFYSQPDAADEMGRRGGKRKPDFNVEAWLNGEEQGAGKGEKQSPEVAKLNRQRARDDAAEERRMAEFQSGGSGAGQEPQQAQYRRDSAEQATKDETARKANLQHQKKDDAAEEKRMKEFQSAGSGAGQEPQQAAYKRETKEIQDALKSLDRQAELAEQRQQNKERKMDEGGGE